MTSLIRNNSTGRTVERHLSSSPLWSMTMVLLILGGCTGDSPADKSPSGVYDLEIIDPTGPRAPWGKTIGDVNNDGLQDIVIGGHIARKLTMFERVAKKLGLFKFDYSGGELVWYQNPTWEKHTITETYRIRTDIEVADIDADGKNDVVAVTDDGLIWFSAEGWVPHTLTEEKLHDIEVVDLDRDGYLDIVARNQSLFGYDNGDRIRIFRQKKSMQWERITLSVPHGEGLALDDMNADGYPDIVVNRVWLQNPGILEAATPWPSHEYATEWQSAATDWAWPSVYIDTGDINEDGKMDILLTPSEEAGQKYQIAWFESPTLPDSDWKKHVVDTDVEAVHHFAALRDIDQDGDLDILTAEMNQGEGDNPVKAYLNKGDGDWTKRIVSPDPSHSMQAVDIDNDFDIDLLGTNWQIADYDGAYPVKLWRNTTQPKISWERRVIDANRPDQAVFIFSQDMDDDGWTDLVTGAYWYKNPGSASSQPWLRVALGAGAYNVAQVADYDNDGDPDFLASGWRGYNQQPTLYQRVLNRLSIRPFDYSNDGSHFVWGENAGNGRFTLHNNIQQATGDFLQGTALLKDPVDGALLNLLSWHQPNQGLQVLNVPAAPTSDTWSWRTMHPTSQDEAISVADIDNDGDEDIVLGTLWLRNEGEGRWRELSIDTSLAKPDRHRVVDLDQDGRLDIVVGFEAVSTPGELVWYQQPETDSDTWVKHPIDILTGPMSLDATDMDGDGDIDILAGEHNLERPERSRLVWYENRLAGTGRWVGHLIYTGDEHHDGAQAVDIDNDGDMDVVSIGWSHHQVLLYENQGKAKP